MKTILIAIITILVAILIFKKTNTRNRDLVPIIENIEGLQKQSILMDDDIFWQVIESCKSDSEEETLNNIRRSLNQYSAVDIIGFQLRFRTLIAESYHSDLWCACYIINGGCSDDGFEYFRYWLLSQGQTVFENAIENPDNLATIVKNRLINSYELEPIAYLPNEIFELKTGKAIYDYIDEDAFYDQLKLNSNIEFSWKEDDPESMKAICPKLYNKFN